MNNFVVSESSIHYIAAFLDRYQEQYQTKHHKDALSELRHLSNMLLDTLEEPVKLNVYRHKLGK